MKLKIVSDGTTAGTNVFTDNGGVEQRIERVRKVTWSIAAEERFAVATIELHGVRIDAELDDGDFTIDEKLALPSPAIEAARRKADEWTALDPPTNIPPDAVRQICEAFAGALLRKEEPHGD